MEKTEGRALLEKLLNKNMKIKMTDGRTLIGMMFYMYECKQMISFSITYALNRLY